MRYSNIDFCLWAIRTTVCEHFYNFNFTVSTKSWCNITTSGSIYPNYIKTFFLITSNNTWPQKVLILCPQVFKICSHISSARQCNEGGFLFLFKE